MMIPEKDSLPPELLELNQWIIWFEERKGDKITKIPAAPWKTGHWKAASATDPDNWTTFDVALEYAKKQEGCGIGFCFKKDGGIVGIDLDHCIEGGAISKFASDVIRKANTYAELSPSEQGVHVIGLGKVPDAMRKKEKGIEVYDRERFFTVTGKRWKDAPKGLNHIEELLFDLYEKFEKEKVAPVIVDKKLEGQIKITDVVPMEGLARHGKQLQGPHPVHGSTTGMNFAVNPEKNVWCCYRHMTGGGPLSWIAVQEGIIKCEEAKPGALRGDKFKKVLKIARERGLLPREDEETEKLRIINVPTITTGDFIAEEVWDGKNPPKFAVYHFDKDKFDFQDEIDLGETDEEGQHIIYRPIYSDHVKKGMILLPREPREATFTKVIDEIFEFLLDREHFDSCGHETEVKLIGLISLGSWFLDRLTPNARLAGIGRFAPILAMRGPSGTGKNRLANLLRLISYRPLFDLSKTKIPSLFRPLDMWKGTLVLDEMDLVKTGETSELTHFLNSRATGTPIGRQNPDDPKAGEVFESFGLTIVTQRRSFQDDATEGRAIPYYCEKTERKLPTVELDETVAQGLDLQDELLYLRMKYWRKFKIDKKAWLRGIDDPRLNAALLPVLALARFEPRILEIANEVAGKIEEVKRKIKASTPDGLMINWIWEKIEKGHYGIWNGIRYVAESPTEEIESPTIETTKPTMTREIADALNWKASWTRRVLNSLNLAPDTAPTVIKVERKSYRPVWFDPKRLEKQLENFIPNYKKWDLFQKLRAYEHPTPKRIEACDYRGAALGMLPRLFTVTQVTEVTAYMCVPPLSQEHQKVPHHSTFHDHNGGVTEVTLDISSSRKNNKDINGEVRVKKTPTHNSSVTSVTCVTAPTAQAIEKAICSSQKTLISKAKLAEDLGVSLDRINVVVAELAKRGKVIDRGGYVGVL